MYMAISMDSFSKEFLQGMCKEYNYIALLHKVHGNIHGSFLLLRITFVLCCCYRYMEISMDPLGQ